MAFDFPASPTEGQVYTPAGGGPVYTYTGGVWVIGSPLTAYATISDTPPGTPLPGQLWYESDTGALYIWFVDANSSQWVQIHGPQLLSAEAPRAECYMDYDAGSIRLSRFNGSKLWINGRNEIIPAAGLLCAAPVTANTTYFIYAYMNAGVMTLEAVPQSTPYVIDAASGMPVKSGDNSRTLVGIGRVFGSGWSAVPTCCASWFNPRQKSSVTSGVVSPTTASTGYVELSTSLRASVVNFSGRLTRISYQFTAYCSVSTADTYTTMGIDGVTGIFQGARTARVNGTGAQAQLPATIDGYYQASEGYHFYTPLGSVSSTNTGTWLNSWTEVQMLG